MKLYIGGAYNGKLELALKENNKSIEDVFFCDNGEIDFSRDIICGIDKLIYDNAINKKETLTYFEKNVDKLRGKIIICDEISQGIVPIKREERFFREETGRILQFLSKESKCVIRVFFGLAQILKDEK